MTERDIGRLPVWARHELQRLQSNVEYLERQLAQAGTEFDYGNPPPGCTVSRELTPTRYVTLPDCGVQFWIGTMYGRPLGINVRHDERGGVAVRSPMEQLAALPEAANTLRIVVPMRCL